MPFASRLQHGGYYTARDAVFTGKQLPAVPKYLVPPYWGSIGCQTLRQLNIDDRCFETSAGTSRHRLVPNTTEGVSWALLGLKMNSDSRTVRRCQSDEKGTGLAISHVLPFAELLVRSQTASGRCCDRPSGRQDSVVWCGLVFLCLQTKLMMAATLTAVTVLQQNCCDHYRTVQLTAMTKLHSSYLKSLCTLNFRM